MSERSCARIRKLIYLLIDASNHNLQLMHIPFSFLSKMGENVSLTQGKTWIELNLFTQLPMEGNHDRRIQ